jgi:predicted transcriptional regulator
VERFPTVISDIMSSPVITIDENYNVRDSSLLMINKKIGSLIITQMGKPVGIVTEKDLIEKVVIPCIDPCETRIGDVMTSPIITIDKNTDILKTVREMRAHNVSHLIVRDGEEMVGIVSEKDLLRGISIASLTSFSSLLRIE